MASNALIGYAVLRANYNANAPTYLDNFTGFVLSVMADAPRKYVDRHEISEAILSSFGIRVPDLVVGKLLKRTRKREQTNQISPERFELTEIGMRDAPQIAEQVEKYRLKQRELGEHFRAFVREEYPDHSDLLEQDVDTELAKYFEQHAVPLLNQAIRGRNGDSNRTEPGFAYLISAFVTRLSKLDVARFAYVEEASKGAILASVLTLDTLAFSTSMQGTSLYLDTPVLMNVLGCHGDIPQAASLDLVRLAREQGADVSVFAHSMQETDAILEGVEAALQRGRSKSTRAAYLHFAETGHSAADIAVLRKSIGRTLAGLDISVREKPEDYARFGLDEAKLEKMLQDAVHYRDDATRVTDVKSLSAIHRLRRGTSARHLEDCRAVMVTSNVSLVIAANSFERDQSSFSLAITEESAAGLLWVRSSAIDDELPRSQLLATVYSGMQPNGNLWIKYLEEVDQLEARAAVSADEALILRSSTSARSALMEETLGDLSSLSSEAPLLVLERLKSDVAMPYLQQLETLQSAQSHVSDELIGAQQELDAARSQSARLRLVMDNQVSRIDKRAGAWAKVVVRGPLVLVALALVGVTVVFYFGGSVAVAGFPGWLFAVAGLAVALPVVRQFIPGTVLDWLGPLEHKLSARLRTAALKRAGLEGVAGGG
jgi:hypothetical protein